MVKQVYPYGVVELTSEGKIKEFKVNGQRLKVYVAKVEEVSTSLKLTHFA